MRYMFWNLKTPWGNDYAVYFLGPANTVNEDEVAFSSS